MSLSFLVLKIFDFYFCPDTYASPVKGPYHNLANLDGFTQN